VNAPQRPSSHSDSPAAVALPGTTTSRCHRPPTPNSLTSATAHGQHTASTHGQHTRPARGQHHRRSRWLASHGRITSCDHAVLTQEPRPAAHRPARQGLRCRYGRDMPVEHLADEAGKRTTVRQDAATVGICQSNTLSPTRSSNQGAAVYEAPAVGQGALTTVRHGRRLRALFRVLNRYGRITRPGPDKRVLP
jgi:hypothetical protein